MLESGRYTDRWNSQSAERMVTVPYEVHGFHTVNIYEEELRGGADDDQSISSSEESQETNQNRVMAYDPIN